MKTIQQLRLAFTALLLTLSSCSSDESDSAIQTSDMATYIFATVNGESFKTFELNGFLSAQTANSDSRIIITGMDQNQNGMTIYLSDITQMGTYTISAENFLNRIGYGNDASGVTVSSTADCDGVTGTIIVTALTDTKIEGTFELIANNDECTAQTSVTQGSFRGTFPN